MPSDGHWSPEGGGRSPRDHSEPCSVSARSIPLPRVSMPLPRFGPHFRRRLLALAFFLGLLLATFMIVRESSLVAVRDVEIRGASGREADRIRAALEGAARDMTTLHVDRDALRTAVAPYPSVKDVVVTADFPHGMRIEVLQHVPVAVVGVDGRDVPVAADGTLLRGTSVKGLPVVPLRTPPAGERIGSGVTARVVALLGDAPAVLRERIENVYVGGRGLTMRLDSGTVLYFGTTERGVAKWAATARVLADPSSKGATYLDVRLPERPAAGGLEQVAAQRKQTVDAGGTAPSSTAQGSAPPVPSGTPPGP